MTLDVDVDKEGFLRNLSDWNESVAHQLADQDEIELTRDHWQVINIVRDYYANYHISPVTRVLVSLVKKQLGPDKGQSIVLMQLFRGKPAKFISKIAGLPKPNNCD